MEEGNEITNGVLENVNENNLDPKDAEQSPSVEQTNETVNGVYETTHIEDAAFDVTTEESPEKFPSVNQAENILPDNSETPLQDKPLEFIARNEEEINDTIPHPSFDTILIGYEEPKQAVEVAVTDCFVPTDPQFPVIYDPGLETIFLKYEALKRKAAPSDEEKYLELRKIIGVAPVESFYKSLAKEEIDLSFYCVNPKGIRAMAETLFYNPYVFTLNLESNHLTCDAVYHLGEMLNINGALTELNLKGCRIGPRGAEALAEGLHANASLLTLNLAGNAITDDGLKFLILPFTEHVTLENIILSDNALTQRSALRLSKPLEGNSMLKELDLSWNYLNSTDGCRRLFGGILKSTSIVSVNLSWNGLDEFTAKHIAFCLGRSVTLERLDVSNNSLNDNCVMVISKALQKNEYLKFLKLSMNPFTNEGAKSLLEKLLNPKPVLEVLDIGNIMVEKDFREVLSKVKKVRIIKVIFGGYRSLYTIKGPNIKELLLKRAKYVAKKRKKNKKDFGQFILKLGEKPVKREEFEESINVAKIKLDYDLMQEIMNAFNIKKKVNVQEMKDEYMKIFPDTTLVEKKKKGKGKKKGKKGKATKGKKK